MANNNGAKEFASNINIYGIVTKKMSGCDGRFFEETLVVKGLTTYLVQTNFETEQGLKAYAQIGGWKWFSYSTFVSG